VPLRTREPLGKGGAQEVGSAGRVDQQGAAGAHHETSAIVVPVVRGPDQIGEVVSCVARRRHRRDLKLAGGDEVTVTESAELVGERHRFACGIA